MSLNSKTKFVNLVVRKKGIDIESYKDKIIQWCNTNCELYVGIFHLHDHSVVTGEIEEPHLHLVMTMKERKLLSTFLNSFCHDMNFNTLGIMIDKVNSYEGSIQYLLHKNDKLKDQHYFNELFHNYDESELKTIIECDTQTLSVEKLYEIVINSVTNYDIMRALGLGRYAVYRKIILDLKDDIRIAKYRKSNPLTTYEDV